MIRARADTSPLHSDHDDALGLLCLVRPQTDGAAALICCRARMDGRMELEEENREKEVDIEYKEPAEGGRQEKKKSSRVDSPGTMERKNTPT